MTVTRLPTAAPRKVINDRFAEQRRAAREMRQGRAVIMPFQRETNAKEDRLARLHRSPELATLMAILMASPLEMLGRIEAAANILLIRSPGDDAVMTAQDIIGAAIADRRTLEAIKAFAMQEAQP